MIYKYDNNVCFDFIGMFNHYSSIALIVLVIQHLPMLFQCFQDRYSYSVKLCKINKLIK